MPNYHISVSSPGGYVLYGGTISFSLVNKAKLVYNIFLLHLLLVYIYIYQSLHVSGDCVPIIRRNSCVCVTLGTCYFVDDCLV